MARSNGQSEVKPQDLDSEHELPASDDTEDLATAIDPPAAGLR